MFDPTVYENLKVVLEGAVYDLDLAGSIRVTAREDLVNLASMSRTYKIGFQLAAEPSGASTAPAPVSAEMELSTGLKDLAAEILEQQGADPGCSLDIAFRLELPAGVQASDVCPGFEMALRQVWGARFAFRQTLSQEFGAGESLPVQCLIRVLLDRRINEEMTEDLSRLVDHAVLSLEELAR